jgi:prepilin-type N-terminal cleavage/methylation domain-containing protein
MNRKGFTLLELIVVLIVMGALVAIAMPQYMMFVERSRAAEAITAIGGIKAAEEANWISSNPSSYAAGAWPAGAATTSVGLTLQSTHWGYVATAGGLITATRTAVDAPAGLPANTTIILQLNAGTGSTWGAGSHPGQPRQN